MSAWAPSLFGARRDGENVDEAVRALGRQHVFKLLVLLPEQGGLAAPDDADVHVTVEQRRLGTVGVEELDQLLVQPAITGFTFARAAGLMSLAGSPTV